MRGEDATRSSDFRHRSGRPTCGSTAIQGAVGLLSQGRLARLLARFGGVVSPIDEMGIDVSASLGARFA